MLQYLIAILPETLTVVVTDGSLSSDGLWMEFRMEGRNRLLDRSLESDEAIDLILNEAPK